MRWFRWGDGIPAILVTAAALTWLFIGLSKPQGAFVRIETPSQTQTVSLSEEAVLTVGGNGYTLTLQVKNGEVSVVSSDCPDKVCVHTGAISQEGHTIACVPAGVILMVEGVGDASVDAVTR